MPWLLERRTAPGALDDALPAGVVVIGYTPPRPGDQPLPGLLYYPDIPASSATRDDDARLRESERIEFAERNPAAAARLYERITADAKPDVRRVALNRLARALRKSGNAEAALRVYDRIEPMGDARIEGLPAGLLARVGRASVLEAANRKTDLAREATTLADDLTRGRWRSTRSEYTFYRREAQTWLLGRHLMGRVVSVSL